MAERAERLDRVLPNMPNSESLRGIAPSGSRALSAERLAAQEAWASRASRVGAPLLRVVPQSESLAWVALIAPTPTRLLDRVNPAAVAIAMLGGFGFAVGVGSLLFR